MGPQSPAANGSGRRKPSKEDSGRFRALVEATSDWLWELDAQGRYTYSNPKVQEVLGYRPDEVLGKTPFDFMAPAEARRVAELFASIVAERRAFHELVNVNQHKDGHEVMLETSGVPIFTDEGRFAGYRGIDRDVTERVHAERRLRLADAALHASGEGIIVADANGNISAVNPAWTTMSGYPEAALLGREPSMLSAAESTRAGLWTLLDSAPRWSGEGTCRSRSGHAFPVWMTLSVVHDEERLVTGFVGIVSDMTERRAAEATIRFQANHDAVTQLANRTAFLSALTRALAEGARDQERVAVLFVDLDGFKPVNDLHGHGVGDVLLAATARRLENCVRRTDLVARFGGDEFTILLRRFSNEAAARRVASACVKAIAAPYRLEGLQVRVGASIGVAMSPQHATTTDTLIAAADVAMYEAKHAGGNRVVVSGATGLPVAKSQPKREKGPVPRSPEVRGAGGLDVRETTAAGNFQPKATSASLSRMNAPDFVKQAWALKDEAQRKDFVRAHVHALPREEVEAALVDALEQAGWNLGLLMVALRVLQVVPSERLLHSLMAMVSEGATFVPGGAKLRPWLAGHLKALRARHPLLAEAAGRYRRPEWAKRPGERAPAAEGTSNPDAARPGKAETEPRAAKKTPAKAGTKPRAAKKTPAKAGTKPRAAKKTPAKAPTRR